MTDEEMAEDYAETNWEWYEDGQRDYIAIKQAFLAGLKAGRTQNEWHSPDEHIDKDEVVLGIINHCNKLRYSLVQWNGEWWYQYGTYNEEVKLITWVDTPEVPNDLKRN